MPEPASLEEFGGAIAERAFLGKPAPTREAHERRQHRVLEDVQLWQQVIELEDEADVAVAIAILARRSKCANVFATETNRARVGIRAVETTEEMKQRALAAA